MGKLIIFEGLDGSGKGTQAELACQNLHSKGYDPLKASQIMTVRPPHWSRCIFPASSASARMT